MNEKHIDQIFKVNNEEEEKEERKESNHWVVRGDNTDAISTGVFVQALALKIKAVRSSETSGNFASRRDVTFQKS